MKIIPVCDDHSRVIINEMPATRTHRLRLYSPQLVLNAQPGQFVNLRIQNNLMPLLRRPFSIHRINLAEGWLEVLFDIRGPGTEILAQMQPGAEISVLGPLGQPFRLRSDLNLALLIGGGLGIAPLLFLAESLRQRQIETHCFYGVRSAAFQCTTAEFEAAGVALHPATDDGSTGFSGWVTDLFLAELKSGKFDESSRAIFACGPPVMLRKIQEIGLSQKIETQLSLEAYMGCGFGVCVGCAVPVKNPATEHEKYKLVCQHGPVFLAEEVIIPD